MKKSELREIIKKHLQEIKISKPKIEIIPQYKNSGYIIFENYEVNYEIKHENVYVDLTSSLNLLNQYTQEEINDEGEYLAVEESVMMCNDYIQFFKNIFGKDVTIEKDDEGVNVISIPLNLFMLKTNNIIQSLGNNKFEYKGIVRILKKMTPNELNDFRNKYAKIYHEAFPHMGYDKFPEETWKGKLDDDKDVYYIMDENNNHIKSSFNPGKGKIDLFFSIKKNKNLKDNKLELINIFK